MLPHLLRDTQLTPSFSVLPCASPADAAALRNYITEYAAHPAQFKYQGKVFVSTFSGEGCTFGQGNAAQGWKSQFTDQLTGPNSVFFVPSFFVDPATFNQYTSIDGMFNVRISSLSRLNSCSYVLPCALHMKWNSAWPIQVTTNNFNQLVQKSGAVVGKLLGNTLMTQISKVVQGVASSLDSDHQYINALGGKTYLASGSYH